MGQHDAASTILHYAWRMVVIEEAAEARVEIVVADKVVEDN